MTTQPPIRDPHAPSRVQEVPDANTIWATPVHETEDPAHDIRSDAEKEAARIVKEIEAAEQKVLHDAQRKVQAEALERADAITNKGYRLYSTRMATRATTSLNRWTDVRAAMKATGVQVHPATGGGFTISRPEATGAGEPLRVASIMQGRRRQADQLIDVIASSWGLLVSDDEQPTCGVAKCRKKGERLSPGFTSLICEKHSSRA